MKLSEGYYAGLTEEGTEAQTGTTFAQRPRGQGEAEPGPHLKRLCREAGCMPTRADQAHPSLLPDRPSPPGPTPHSEAGLEKSQEGRGLRGRRQRESGRGPGPHVPPACARVRAAQVRGRKLSLFSHQLCRSRRQSRACPRPGPDFSYRWVLTYPGRGLQPWAWCGPGRRGRHCHVLPAAPRVLDSQATSPQPPPGWPGSPGRPLLRPSRQPCWGYGCAHITDGKTEAPRGPITE